jgi:DNA-binding MarR family transcriptional regulator
MDEATSTVTLELAQQTASLVVGLARRVFLPEDDQMGEMPVAQLRVCGILSSHGGPQAMSALSRELGVSLSAMTQIADRLERAGLVRRVAEGSDRRVRCLQLTERGEKIMRQREEARVRRMAAALEHLSPGARHEVLAGLRTLAGACAAASEQGVCAAADK